MDYDVLQTALWGGFGIGLSIMAGITAIMLPAAYAMNRFIYHAWPMRLLLGLMAGLGFIVSAPLLMIRTLFGFDKEPIHYFGLLPLFAKPAWANTFAGFTAMPFRLLAILLEPFFIARDPKNASIDEEGFKACMKHLVVADDGKQPKTYDLKQTGKPEDFFEVRQNAVCEKLFELIRQTGVIQDRAAWVKKVNDLSAVCEFMFGIVADQAEAGGPPPPPPPGGPGDGVGQEQGDGAGGPGDGVGQGQGDGAAGGPPQ